MLATAFQLFSIQKYLPVFLAKCRFRNVRPLRQCLGSNVMLLYTVDMRPLGHNGIQTDLQFCNTA